MSEYRIFSEDSETLTRELIEAYEEKTGRALHPADPERLFIAWLQSVIEAERNRINFTAEQNIISKAKGEYLDRLGEWLLGVKRPQAAAAKCEVEFRLQNRSPLGCIIPRGTRITDDSNTLIFETCTDAVIRIDTDRVTVTAQCQTEGAVGNGFVPGQLCRLIDVDSVQFLHTVQNLTVSSAGAEEATDEEYFELLKSSMGRFSCGGSKKSYEYYAKTASNMIGDAVAVIPRKSVMRHSDITSIYGSTDGYNRMAVFSSAGIVNVDGFYIPNEPMPLTAGEDYVLEERDGLFIVKIPSGKLTGIHSLMISAEEEKAGCVDIYATNTDGEPADEALLNEIAAVCNDDSVRAMTDKLEAKAPQEVNYYIGISFDMSRETMSSASEVERKINETVEEFVKWQSAKIGRDINPSKLMWMLSDCGALNLTISNPTHRMLSDGSDGHIPQVARLAGYTLIDNGGIYD